MKKLREASLKTGDIILTTTTHAVSKAIRTATKSDISHAMIYVQDHSVIDATAEGVQARNTQRLFFDDDCAIHVLRPRSDLPADQVRAVCNYVRAQVGAQYATMEAIHTAIGGVRRWTRKQFCSRLVALAYASVKVKLVSDPNFCSPAELKDIPLLVEVQNATVAVTAEEATVWQGRDDLPQIMRDATNAIFDGARKKNKNIQNFDDLHRHLAAHPEDDEHFCDLLERSGYLTVWRIEKDKNPWQYDIELMPPSADVAPGIEEYCWSLLSGEEDGPNRYIVNRGGYELFSRQFGLRFFGIMADLSGHLASLHRTRVEVAAKWLQARGPIEIAPTPIRRPHTPEWFEALAIWNPVQAAHTRRVIESSGTPNVCSVCGDDPARDYRLEESHRSPAGVDTLRLCDDCVRIRSEGGEPYVELPDE
jgi:Permuted papain-like amidase enzyme, YaeF/YiiX, C92 family